MAEMTPSTAAPQPVNPTPVTTVIQHESLDLITEVRHLLPYLGDLVTRPGSSTSEFWVAILTKPIAGVVSFALAFLVAHSLIDNAVAQAVSASVVGAAVTLLSGLGAHAYVKARGELKVKALELLRYLQPLN